MSDHVVDKTVLIPNACQKSVVKLISLSRHFGLRHTCCLVLRLVLLFVDLLEDVLEATIVLLEDGVLRAQVQREAALESELQRAVGEVGDTRVRVVHCLRNSRTVLEVEDSELQTLATSFRRPGDLEFAITGHDKVGGLVLVAIGMTTNDDRLLPSRHDLWNILCDVDAIN